jgi:hypothetical protein
MSTFDEIFLTGARKSIQRGVIDITGGSTSATATISAVVMAKAELRYGGATGADAARVSLTNATTITATRSNSTGTTSVSWELTEFY